MEENRPIEKISIIGAGNIGWHLAKAFCSSGVEIVNVISRDRTKGEELAAEIGASFIMSVDDLHAYPDALVIAVQDKEIRDVVEKVRGQGIPLIHVSGSTGMEVFEKFDGHFGVLYPLQTFTRKIEMAYNDIPFLLEANSPVFLKTLNELALRVSSKILDINSRQRLKIHLAAVYACNFSNHMAAVAEKLLKEENLDMNLIRPLMEQTFRKLLSMSALTTQTGPAVREDDETMQKHISALGSLDAEKEIYTLISKQIIKYRDQGYE